MFLTWPLGRRLERSAIKGVWARIRRAKVKGTSAKIRRARRSGKELTLDQLELGDHLEIKFTTHDGEESAANTVPNQTEQMRQKHGRIGTYFGYATEITIVTPTNAVQTNSAAVSNPVESSR